MKKYSTEKYSKEEETEKEESNLMMKSCGVKKKNNKITFDENT